MTGGQEVASVELRLTGAKRSKRAGGPGIAIAVGLILATALAVGWYLLHSGPRQAVREVVYGAKMGTETESVENLRQLALALRMCAQEHGDILPYLSTAGDVEEVLRPYVESEQVFRDPGTDERYGHNSFLGMKRLSDIPSPDKVPCFYERTPGADNTWGVAFLDGHAARVSESEWAAIKEALYLP